MALCLFDETPKKYVTPQQNQNSHDNLAKIEFDVELLPIANPLAHTHKVHCLMKFMHVKVFEFFFCFFVFIFMSFTSFMNIKKKRCVVLKLDGIKLPLQENKSYKKHCPSSKTKSLWRMVDNKEKKTSQQILKQILHSCVLFFEKIIVHVFQFVTNCIHVSWHWCSM